MATDARKMPEALSASHHVGDEADAIHTLLIKRADERAGCTEGSKEEAELKLIADALESYEVMRWPEGKVAGRGEGEGDGKMARHNFGSQILSHRS